MAEKKCMSLDAFKELASEKREFVDGIIGRVDIIDIDHGVMRIYSENINKYLEEYACKDAEDLQDTLWYNYGIYCEIKP